MTTNNNNINNHRNNDNNKNDNSQNKRNREIKPNLALQNNSGLSPMSPKIFWLSLFSNRTMIRWDVEVYLSRFLSLYKIPQKLLCFLLIAEKKNCESLLAELCISPLLSILAKNLIKQIWLLMNKIWKIGPFAHLHLVFISLMCLILS